jgi:hypothetical protein
MMILVSRLLKGYSSYHDMQTYHSGDTQKKVDLVQLHWHRLYRNMTAQCQSCGKGNTCKMSLLRAANIYAAGKFVKAAMTNWRDCAEQRPVKHRSEKLYNVRNSLGGLKACLSASSLPQHPN